MTLDALRLRALWHGELCKIGGGKKKRKKKGERKKRKKTHFFFAKNRFPVLGIRRPVSVGTLEILHCPNGGPV